MIETAEIRSSLLCQYIDRSDDGTSEYRKNPSSAGLVTIVVSIVMGLDTHCENNTAKRFLVEVKNLIFAYTRWIYIIRTQGPT